MRCIELTGSDNRMDSDIFYGPVNSLPIKCDVCGFPDLDHVPQPYYLVKSRTMSPNEMAPAENGNFFVRDRIRTALELLAPDDFSSYPTCYNIQSVTDIRPRPTLWRAVATTSNVRAVLSGIRIDSRHENSELGPADDNRALAEYDHN